MDKIKEINLKNKRKMVKYSIQNQKIIIIKNSAENDKFYEEKIKLKEKEKENEKDKNKLDKQKKN